LAAGIRDDFLDVARACMETQVVRGLASTMHCFKIDGGASGTREETIRKLTGIGGTLLTDDLVPQDSVGDGDEDPSWEMFFFWPDAAIKIEVGQGITLLYGATTNLERAREIVSLVPPLPAEPDKLPTSGHLFFLMPTPGGFDLVSLGDVSETIIRGNYAPQVVEAFDYIVGEFNTSDPSGRLVLLRGPAGTGKTHFWQALAGSTPNALFVKVQAHQISYLSDPSFLPTLLRLRAQHTGRVRHHLRRGDLATPRGCLLSDLADLSDLPPRDVTGEAEAAPIVIVVEDADYAVVARDGVNIREISTLLSLGDGIEGRVFNLRVILTTNARVEQIDEAIQRDERLCADVLIDRLGAQQANAVLRRLRPEAHLSTDGSPPPGHAGPVIEGFTSPATLAQAYRRARVRKMNGRAVKPALGFQTVPDGCR